MFESALINTTNSATIFIEKAIVESLYLQYPNALNSTLGKLMPGSGHHWAVTGLIYTVTVVAVLL